MREGNRAYRAVSAKGKGWLYHQRLLPVAASRRPQSESVGGLSGRRRLARINSQGLTEQGVRPTVRDARWTGLDSGDLEEAVADPFVPQGAQEAEP